VVGLLELFDGQSASDSMLRLVAGTVLLFLMGLTEALALEETKKDNIGPWEIEATFKDNKFDHCAINRKVDEVVASFLRTSDGLSLTLESPNWKLDRGKNYPVRMKAGAASWSTDVAAETNSVSVPISDKKFKEGLRAANVFMVEGAGSTIRIPLDQSRAALDRLDNCLTKNSRAVETNPFVAPTRQP
jgi:predicted regulator of Ras-like GTPase activity (Roadblock/LC7/MglB family)